MQNSGETRIPTGSPKGQSRHHAKGYGYFNYHGSGSPSYRHENRNASIDYSAIRCAAFRIRKLIGMDAIEDIVNIRLLFFGAVADVVGKRGDEISLKSRTTTSKAFSQIIEEFPRLSSTKLLFALNQEFATGDEIIRDGDELAIFTAVSGG